MRRLSLVLRFEPSLPTLLALTEPPFQPHPEQSGVLFELIIGEIMLIETRKGGTATN